MDGDIWRVKTEMKKFEKPEAIVNDVNSFRLTLGKRA